MANILDYSKESFCSAVKKLRKQCEQKDGYVYFMPSPHQGKMFYIHGWIYPEKVADMVADVWSGKKTVDEIPEMQEIDIPMFEGGSYCG